MDQHNKFSIGYANQLDREDPLKGFRDRFMITDPSLIYLDGNSLGRLPRVTASRLKSVIADEWGDRLIRSWNEGWYEQSSRLGKKIAQIVGAHPDEVIVCDSTSINLYKLVFAALKMRKNRTEIVSDDMNFPSDLYVIQGLIKQFGNQHILRLMKSSDGVNVEMHEMLRIIGKKTALVTLSHVAFKSAYMYDMKAVTDLAHMEGALVIWDLSHSVGAVPIYLRNANVDLAVGCTYKYLNAGPGAPAFLFVRKDLQEQIESPVRGWFGQDDPFKFGMTYKPAAGMKKFLAGSPPLLSQSALEPGLDITIEAGMTAIRKKSTDQTDYLIMLAKEWLVPAGFRLGSPVESQKRGSHVTLKHAEAFRICNALMDREVGEALIIPDFREPNNIRLGVAPLYTTYLDLFLAVKQLKDIVENGWFKRYTKEKMSVT
ncbi:MAG: kynureninase [Bacteroidales bacterium]|nr:kynureninase [Bacteroidales bacterium]MBN2698907.1 kynureninase [Bacteroidales bacterium]